MKYDLRTRIMKGIRVTAESSTSRSNPLLDHRRAYFIELLPRTWSAPVMLRYVLRRPTGSGTVAELEVGCSWQENTYEGRRICGFLSTIL
jgi:hypothetical protein